MSVADYNKAVDAGLITEEQQNALESGVQAKLNSEESITDEKKSDNSQH